MSLEYLDAHWMKDAVEKSLWNLDMDQLSGKVIVCTFRGFAILSCISSLKSYRGVRNVVFCESFLEYVQRHPLLQRAVLSRWILKPGDLFSIIPHFLCCYFNFWKMKAPSLPMQKVTLSLAFSMVHCNVQCIVNPPLPRNIVPKCEKRCKIYICPKKLKRKLSANLLCNQLLDAFKNMQTQCQSKLCERKNIIVIITTTIIITTSPPLSSLH